MQASLCRVIVFCADVKKLTGFYEKYLGLTIVGDLSEDWAVLKSGNFELAFHRIGEEYRKSSPENFTADTNTKFVFEITGSIEDLREKLLENKIEVGELRTFSGMSDVVCDGKDPEGNVFQLKLIHR